jgi:hypothetical protein
MKLIETKTLGSSAASIVFTSIPQTFTDLLILFSIRSDRTQGAEVCRITVNSNAVTGRYLRGIGGASFSSSTNIDFYVAGADSTANTFGNGSIYLSNYSLTTVQKSISTDSVTANNSDNYGLMISASNRASNDAVTSLTLAPITGPNFLTGSTVSLYGILKGSDGITTAS